MKKIKNLYEKLDLDLSCQKLVSSEWNFEIMEDIDLDNMEDYIKNSAKSF